MDFEPPAMFGAWVDCWRRAIIAARSHGVDESAIRLEIAPPATEEQVRQVETTLKFRLPEQFRQTLLEFSGRVHFFWYLRRDDAPPGPLSGVFCGSCSWDIERLFEEYQQVVWLSQNAFVRDVPDEVIWKDKLPFHWIASGDFIVLDQTSGRVVYLGRELEGSHAHCLGRDFFDFMHRWTSLGCPDDDIWDRFTRSKDSYIDLDHDNARQWCQWFGLPQPSRVP